MASQQPTRPWSRLGSIRLPPPAAPTPSPTQQPDTVPRPRPVIRPAFSQTFRGPLALPQESTPPSPPAAAAASPPRPPPVTAPTPPTIVTPERPAPPTATRAPEPSPPPPARTSPPPPPPPPRASPPPPSPTAPRPPATTTTSSVPPSPIIRTSAPSSSLPNSPPANMQYASSSSVPQSPKPKVSAPPTSSSLPDSPPLKPATSGPLTSSNSSPKPKFLGPSSSSPSSPAPKVASPSTLAPPLSPYLPPPATTTTIGARSSHPTSSPKAITANTPSSSPKIRYISHPPSPLTLPPAQLKSDNEREPKIPQEAEQKTVLVQETMVKPKLTNTTSNNDPQKYVNEIRNLSIGRKANREVAKDKGNYKKNSDSEDFGMRVITIAGDNKGAIMELSPSRKNKGNPRAWSDGENLAKGHNDYKPPMSTTMNSNVQGVNNSIMFNASCTHHDPGVHLSLSRNSNGGRGIHMKDRVIKD